MPKARFALWRSPGTGPTYCKLDRSVGVRPASASCKIEIYCSPENLLLRMTSVSSLGDRLTNKRVPFRGKGQMVYGF